MMKILFYVCMALLLGCAQESQFFKRDNEKEIVINSRQGLTWQDDEKVTYETKEWFLAKHYCNTLVLAGFSDWRLPELEELESIVEYKRTTTTINASFMNIEPYYYWSNSSVDSNATYGWNINFHLGLIDNWDHHKKKKFTRCVRGTFKKATSVLMWQDEKTIAKDQKSYEKAKKYCNDLELDGYSDWFLPTIKHLFNMPNKSQKDYQKIKRGFWSQTSLRQFEAYIRYEFSNANNLHSKDAKNYVRCIRKID